MRRALAAAGAFAVLALALPLVQPTVANATTPAKYVKSAHVAFENCPVRTTLLTVTLLNLTYSATQPILIGLTVRNQSGRACGQSRSTANPLANLGIAIGPCGNVSLVVHDAQNNEVFPGPGAIAPCAAPFSVPVPAHHRLKTVGIWSQQLGLNGTTRVPAGRYRIIVDHVITFTVTLTGPGGLPPGTTHPVQPPASGPCGSFFNLVASTPTPATTPQHKCPIDQVAPPPPGSTPTPTVPPTMPTTTTTPPKNRQAASR